MAARRASVQLLGVLQRSRARSVSVRSFQPVEVPRRVAVASFTQGRDVNEYVARTSYGQFLVNRYLHKESQAKNDNEDTHHYERTKMTDEGGGSVESDYGVKAAEVSNRAEKAGQQVKEKASETSEQAKQKTDEVVDKGHEYAEKAKDKAGEVTEEARDKAGEYKEAAKDKASEVRDKAGEYKEAAKDKASEAASEGKEKLNQFKESVKETTSEAVDKAGGATDEGKGQVSKNVDTAKDMFKDIPQKVSETATGLKEVGVEAGKAIKRDASKVAEKVGLKGGD